LSAGDHPDGSVLPAVLVPSEPPSPDKAYEVSEVKARIRAALMSLPPRERKVISLYYFGDVTMKQIGAAIGVNESRVSQLHARAIQRLRKALGAEEGSQVHAPVVEFGAVLGTMRMAKARLREPGERAVVLNYKRPAAARPGIHRNAPTRGLPARRAAAR
jgi:hypothetical protein